MIITIEPDFVAWINQTVGRHGIQVELVAGETNVVKITTPRYTQRYEARDNADLGQLMACILESDLAQQRGAALRKAVEVAA